MGILDFFRPVQIVSADEVRKIISEHGPETYNLVDVRQQKEYERGHLPGAVLIPLDQLESRTNELDPDLPTITY